MCSTGLSSPIHLLETRCLDAVLIDAINWSLAKLWSGIPDIGNQELPGAYGEGKTDAARAILQLKEKKCIFLSLASEI